MLVLGCVRMTLPKGDELIRQNDLVIAMVKLRTILGTIPIGKVISTRRQHTYHICTIPGLSCDEGLAVTQAL